MQDYVIIPDTWAKGGLVNTVAVMNTHHWWPL